MRLESVRSDYEKKREDDRTVVRYQIEGELLREARSLLDENLHLLREEVDDIKRQAEKRLLEAVSANSDETERALIARAIAASLEEYGKSSQFESAGARSIAASNQPGNVIVPISRESRYQWPVANVGSVLELQERFRRSA